MNHLIPKYNETFDHIIEILKSEDIIHRRELIRKVVDKYYSHLPEELLEQRIKSGDILIHNRIAWGISYLKQSEFITYPKRGFVKITEKGLAHQGALSPKEVDLEISKTNVYKSKDAVAPLSINTQNSTPEDLINEGFNKIEEEVKNELLEKLKNIDPYYFEKVILLLLRKMGMEILSKQASRQTEVLMELLMKINLAWIRSTCKRRDSLKIK